MSPLPAGLHPAEGLRPSITELISAASCQLGQPVVDKRSVVSDDEGVTVRYNMSDRTIIPLGAARVAAAGALLARAFEHDSLYEAVSPDALIRREKLAWLFSGIVRHSLRYGTVHTTSELEGVACWLPSEHIRMGIGESAHAGLLRAPLVLGWQTLRSLSAYLRASSTLHRRWAPGKHIYLFIIAVDPFYQGIGVGSRLMEAGLQLADSAGLPCYLETGSERNVRFYTRFGFREMERISPANIGRVVAMLR